MIYFTLKIIHIIGSTLLFGTGLGSAFYMWCAHLSKNIQAIAVTARNVVLADWLFTATAVVIQPLTGFLLVYVVGYDWRSFWIIGSLLLYVFTGLCWLPVVWIQIKIRDLVEHCLTTQQALPPQYYRYMRIWICLGWPAFIVVIIIFCLMVLKPI